MTPVMHAVDHSSYNDRDWPPVRAAFRHSPTGFLIHLPYARSAPELASDLAHFVLARTRLLRFPRTGMPTPTASAATSIRLINAPRPRHRLHTPPLPLSASVASGNRLEPLRQSVTLTDEFPSTLLPALTSATSSEFRQLRIPNGSMPSTPHASCSHH